MASATPAFRSATAGSSPDVRQLIPPLGLKEYWYPALEDRKVKRRPVGLKICGVDLVFFRGGDGQVKCLWNVCPHRGGSLMHGDCHYPGTISCPYHGWTYDGDGNVLAVLPEGPDSQVPGKVRARAYPTVTLKGMVFVWMGEGQPAPPRQDIPPEFFDDYTTILFTTEMWEANWNVALENGVDAHVPYVHRNSAKQLMHPMRGGGPQGARNKIVKGRAVLPLRLPGSTGRTSSTLSWPRVYFPSLGGYWPKHRTRLLWVWIFSPARKRAAKYPAWECPEEWRPGHHLPAMFRNDHRTDMYTRNSVPVTEVLSRQIYFKAVRPKSWVGRFYERAHFRLIGRWLQAANFSTQDFRAVAPQRYDTPEHLSSTDSHQVLWRRLILQSRDLAGRQADGQPADTPAEEFSYARQAEVGREPERFQAMVSQD